ncbi:ABC transporter substrate-binding protein [Crenobacter intestini]|uniref:ABC transporter substrate-binding protein n=1 Tax=Crenobacter intestini TaxID=2563443 RepID=UPI001F372D95|nr:ABC transporter substrate-binding protein [Crenobacter intestini]
MLSAALPACVSEPPLKLSTHPWPGHGFLWLAQQQGVLAAGGVRLIELASASTSLHALSAGIVDAATLTLDEVLRARAGGIPLTIVLVLDSSAGADMLVARDKVADLSALAGKRIGFERSATGALMLSGVLKAAGLSAADVELVDVGINMQEAAWRAGKIDAAISYPPVATRLIKHGGHVLFDSRSLPDTIFDVVAVREEALLAKPAAVATLIDAHLKGVDKWRGSNAYQQHMLTRWLGLPPAKARRIFDGLKPCDTAENLRLLGGTSPLLAQVADTLVLKLAAENIDARANGPTPLIDATHFPEHAR